MSDTTMAARKKFWQPYLSGNVNNMLVYTDVLFFRDDSGNYLRNIYVNGLAGGADEIRKRAPAKAFHGSSRPTISCRPEKCSPCWR